MLDVTCAAPQRHGPLTVFPLIAGGTPELPYTLMADALTAGSLKITELGSGTVPELLATNTGATGILVLDGEQLVGAKQNRTTNRSMILPAESETRIPVSCMEQGRWKHMGDDFKPTKQSSPGSVRRRAREVEADYLTRGDVVPVSALSVAQGGVWSTIALYSANLGAAPPTGALDSLYATRDADIEHWTGSFPGQPKQIGLLAFLGARPLGLDVIGCTLLYRALHGRLLRGYVLDALGHRTGVGEPGEDQAQLFLRHVNSARRVPSATPGIGDYAILSGRVIGGELTAVQTLVHLSAFPVIDHSRSPETGGDPEAPISPPSLRRRRMD
jgi:hypothetical protein